MAFVDHGAVPRGPGSPVAAPGECGVDHQGLRYDTGTIGGVRDEIPIGIGASDGIAGERVVPSDGAADGFGVGIEQELGGIEPVTLIGSVGAVHPVAVRLAGTDIGQVPVPDIAGAFCSSIRSDSRWRSGIGEEA